MKKIILSLVLIPIAGIAGFHNSIGYSSTLVEVRGGEWPISLERSISYSDDTTYSLLFRDQQIIQDVVMDTIAFPNLAQLKYLEKALTALKKGTNGDIARFRDYSINRADIKRNGTWYVLHHREWGVTNFEQQQADILIVAIRKL
ncbi:MAG: hypothetical protein C5B59_20185 [Bacteroidetes bacterium]|nr:MAG: hypothetical protein C5B59_20185 [Bacteroidota bacterium]